MKWANMLGSTGDGNLKIKVASHALSVFLIAFLRPFKATPSESLLFFSYSISFINIGL